jgi:hypothetical protein
MTDTLTTDIAKLDTAAKKRKPAPKRKAPAKKPAAKKAPVTKTLSAPAVAELHNMSAKTLRARIRRNADKWADIIQRDGTSYVFKDNVTTRKAIAALLS